MEFRDLHRQYEFLKDEIAVAVSGVLEGSHYIMGPQVKELENQLANYVGVKHCITCANGTDALTLALKVWGIGAGDAVFVPDFTFFSSAEVVSLEGATPVFVDMDEATFNMCAESLEKVIRTTIEENKLTPKAVIAVDLFGQPANYPAIRKICDKYGLFLLEDGAQGFGGNINGKRNCSFGDISTTSFFPAKPVGCYGDGGAVFTDSDEWAGLLESYRVHGKGTFKYDNVRVGMNSRLDTLQAAILQVKLKAFCEFELDRINEAAQKYDERLVGVVATPVVPAGFYSSWAQYTIRLKSSEQRDALQTKLKEQGIPTMIYYPTPMHGQTVYKPLGYTDQQLPVAKKLSDTVLSLPIHPYITTEDIDTVCKAIKEALQ